MRRRFALVLVTLLPTACSSAISQYPARDERGFDDAGRADVDDGARAYGALLERWGTWERDALDGVHWCPRVDQLRPSPAYFSPYAKSSSYVGADARGPGAAWSSDDAETWRAITATRGRWVHDESGPRPWCWVPGVALHRPEIRIRSAMRPAVEGGLEGAEGERVQRAVLHGVGAALSVASDVLDVASALSRGR